jgi:hypothetical protein
MQRDQCVPLGVGLELLPGDGGNHLSERLVELDDFVLNEFVIVVSEILTE